MNRRKFFSGLLCLPIVGALFRKRQKTPEETDEETNRRYFNESHERHLKKCEPCRAAFSKGIRGDKLFPGAKREKISDFGVTTQAAREKAWKKANP